MASQDFGPIARNGRTSSTDLPISRKKREAERQRDLSKPSRLLDGLAQAADLLKTVTGGKVYERQRDTIHKAAKDKFPKTTDAVEKVADFIAKGAEYDTTAMLPGAQLGILLGPKALHFPHAKADEAFDLLRKGWSPEDIRAKTGIYFDSAGRPRFEKATPDEFVLTPDGEKWSKGRALDSRWRPETAEKTVYAPTLYENYPMTKDWPVRVGEDGGVSGAFQPDLVGRPFGSVDAYGPQMRVPTRLQPRLGSSYRDVLVHELSGHGVDWIEGSDFGAMPETVGNAVKGKFPGVSDYDLYTRAGGETRANMIQNRNSLDADLIKEISPYHNPEIEFDPRKSSFRDYQEAFPRSEQWSRNFAPGQPRDFRHTPILDRPAFDPAKPGASRSEFPEPPPGALRGVKGRKRAPISKMATEDASLAASGAQPVPSGEGAATPVAGGGGRPPASPPEATTGGPPPGPRRRGRISQLGHNGGPTFSDEELLRQAMETPRPLNREGDFRGAPPGLNTPEAEAAFIQQKLDELRGYRGRGEGFYDEAQSAIRNWTNDPVMSRRFVSGSGHTSNMTSPLPNTNHAIRGMNQYAVGDEVNTGMFHQSMSPKVEESFRTDTLSPDPKTGPYSYALLPPEHRPADFADHVRLRGEGRALKGGAVHDTWDKEAFGYPAKVDPATGKRSMPAASDPEHIFMDRVYNKLGNIASRDPAMRRRYGTGQTFKERAQAALWDIYRMEADKFEVPDFRDILDRTSGFTQMAAIPGPSTGVSERLLNAPLDVKRQYTDDMFRALSTEDGANVPARALGMSPPMREGFGPWQGMMEPNRTIDFAVAADGQAAGKTINPSSAKAAKTMRDWNQLALGQEGSAFTMPRVDAGEAKPQIKGGVAARPDAADIVRIQGPAMQSPEDWQRAMDAVASVYGPGWADNIVVQQGRNGELMLKNVSGGNNTEFQNMAGEVHRMLGGTGIERMRDVGNDFNMVRFDDPSYRTLLDETRNNPVLKQTFDEKVLPALANVQAVSEQWAAKMGLPANTVPDRVRRIMVEAGVNWPKAMDEAVKKGIIPAFMLPVMYGAMQGQDSRDGGSR